MGRDRHEGSDLVARTIIAFTTNAPQHIVIISHYLTSISQGTLCTAAANLKANGANRVFAFATHGLFSGAASDRIAASVLEEVVVTNSIPIKAVARANEKIVQLSVAPLVSEAIRRVHLRQSVSALFKPKNTIKSQSE